MEDLLKQHGVTFDSLGGLIYSQCPFCSTGGQIESEPSLHLNEKSQTGICTKCRSIKSLDECLTALGIDSASIKVQHGRLQLWSVGEILAHDFGEEEWLVKSLISKQGITALSGNPGDFKTWLTIHIALCISRGESVFDAFKSIQGNVLIVDEEDHLRLLKKRLSSLGAKQDENIFYLSQSGVKIDDQEIRDQLLSIVREKQIKLVILDSLVRIHQQDENDAKSMSKVFSYISEIIKVGASVLFTHHHRKQSGFGPSNPGQSMRGSSDILAAVDCHLTLEKKKEEDILVVRQSKLRQDEQLEPFELQIIKGELGPTNFEFMGKHDDRKQKADEAAEAVVLALQGGMLSRPDIHKALGEEFGKNSIDQAIGLALESGRVYKVPRKEVPKGDRKDFYRLPKVEFPISQSLIEAGNQETQSLAEEVEF